MKRTMLVSLVFLTFCLCYKNTTAQICNTQMYPPLPRAWEDSTSAKRWAKEFVTDARDKPSKSKILKKRNGNQAFDFVVTANAADSLINKLKPYPNLRIFFANFSACDALPSFPSFPKNKVILLFSLEKADSTIDKYYFIKDHDDSLYEVPQKCAKIWTDSFNMIYQPELIKALKKDPENYFEGALSDTRSVVFQTRNIVEAFITERDYQKERHNIDITGYKVIFSSYTAVGRPRKPESRDQHLYKKRLFVQFDYVTGTVGNERVFNLETQKDEFRCRLEISRPSALRKTKMSMKDALRRKSTDNGQLCPTFCPRTINP